ncbi:MAG: FHA domain-containing protein [Rivularia sp. (in: cyanobacteria)]
MNIQLTWKDAVSQETIQQDFTLPLGIGRESTTIPDSYEEQSLSKAVFNHSLISGFHAVIHLVNGEITFTDRSSNGTSINGVPFLNNFSQPLHNGDVLQIGVYKITVTLPIQGTGTEVMLTPPPDLNPQAANETELATTGEIIPVNQRDVVDAELVESKALSITPASGEATIAFNLENDNLETQIEAPQPPSLSKFPSKEFMSSQMVDVQSLYASGNRVEEIDYVALGGGLGSFSWVDHLRVYGVKPEKIAVLGIDKQPYARYQRLCENSQIPPHERLRSGSDSCPDNLWGWPGYALREAWQDFNAGQYTWALRHLWQVFAEPYFIETYTPKSGKVFDSIDREAERIGWSQMLRYGRIRSIRKTMDGRYAIAYSIPDKNRRSHGFIVGRYLHIATGYPAIKFLQDLQDYRIKTGDFKSVVNAYEEHNHKYQQLERQGGTVIIRGRGIVASRIIQRIFEARKRNPKIMVIHLMRKRNIEGTKFGFSRRQVENHWEFQPFNWPKACWSGDLRAKLEGASPEERYELLKIWGGTTTADRTDWKEIIQKGLDEGWYNIEFGQVKKVERDQNGKPLSYVDTGKGILEVKADFIIDSTGLEAEPKNNPLFKDLIENYNFRLSPKGGLQIANDFEIKEVRNNRGRVYCCGVLTLGGPYAAVDSFLGLQYAAQRSADSLVAAKAPGIGYLDGLGSLFQWIKWAMNKKP